MICQGRGGARGADLATDRLALSPEDGAVSRGRNLQHTTSRLRPERGRQTRRGSQARDSERACALGQRHLVSFDCVLQADGVFRDSDSRRCLIARSLSPIFQRHSRIQVLYVLMASTGSRSAQSQTLSRLVRGLQFSSSHFRGLTPGLCLSSRYCAHPLSIWHHTRPHSRLSDARLVMEKYPGPNPNRTWPNPKFRFGFRE